MDRFSIVSAHAAFADWWNVGGLTARDHDPSRKSGKSAAQQLHSMRYSPGMGDYFTKQDFDAVDCYLALVAKYHPEGLEAEKAHWYSIDETEE